MFASAIRTSARRRSVTRTCGVLAATGGAALVLVAAASAAPTPPGAHALATDSVQAVGASAARDSVRSAVPTHPAPLALLERDGLLRPDRLQHASLSFALASGAGAAGARRSHSVSITLVLGIAKEARDARAGRFDWLDLAADATGAALGAWLLGRR